MLRLGTSAFTAAGWEGAFYPAGLKSADFLTYYATQFDAVEIDSTYYRIPSSSVVRGWYNKTPDNFLFAAKLPQIITHEKALADCASDLTAFLSAMSALKEKLGPLLIQFPYFNRKAFAEPAAFLARLRPFLKLLPKDQPFALETRNKNFLAPPLVDLLREHKVALTLIDHPWLPRPSELVKQFDPVTAPFTYVRFLGDRKGIEEVTTTWNKTIVNRKKDLTEWVEVLRPIARRKIQILAFANNHYAGFAPATVRLFRELWDKRP